MAEEIKVWGEGTKDLWSSGKTIDVPDGFKESHPDNPPRPDWWTCICLGSRRSPGSP